MQSEFLCDGIHTCKKADCGILQNLYYNGLFWFLTLLLPHLKIQGKQAICRPVLLSWYHLSAGSSSLFFLPSGFSFG